MGCGKGEKKGKRRSQVKGSVGDGIKMKGMMKRPGRVRDRKRRRARKKGVMYIGGIGDGRVAPDRAGE